MYWGPIRRTLYIIKYKRKLLFQFEAQMIEKCVKRDSLDIYNEALYLASMDPMSRASIERSSKSICTSLVSTPYIKCYNLTYIRG